MKTTLITACLCFAALAIQAQELKVYTNDSSGKIGLKDESDKIITDPKYDYISHSLISLGGYVNFIAGYSAVEIQDKWGFIDESGNEITPIQYDDVDDFDEELLLALVILNDKMGVINQLGDEITPIKYDNIVLYSEGILVALNNKFGFLDLDGNIKIPVEYSTTNEIIALLKNGK